MSPEELIQQDLKDRLEHREVLQAIDAISRTGPGMTFLTYLFKSFDVGTIPPIGVDGTFLHRELGRLDAGNSIFKIVSEANEMIAAGILAKIQKDRNDAYYKTPVQIDG